MKVASGVQGYERCAGVVVLLTMAVVVAIRIVRPFMEDLAQPLRFLLGIVPNAAAALGLPFVWVIGRRSVRHGHMPRVTGHREFSVVAGLVLILLLGWEFVQLSAWELPFDWHDIAASAVGVCLAVAVHWLACVRRGLLWGDTSRTYGASAPN